jgi:phosphopentomutase
VPAVSSIEGPVTAFARAIVIVLDSAGVGELPDAATYGDRGSNTLGNIAARATLQIPALRALGLGHVVELPGGPAEREPGAAFGKMAERAPGKDSVTGHWELMGLVLDRPFPVFPHGFPSELIREFERRIGRRSLGNCAASGTAIIEELGPEHMRTGSPIVYTSADSVFQIAAHEDVIPVEELYRICHVAYALVVEGVGLGRVIARPFIGVTGRLQRTSNRRDSRSRRSRDRARPREAAGLGRRHRKIDDLFTGRGITGPAHEVG